MQSSDVPTGIFTSPSAMTPNEDCASADQPAHADTPDVRRPHHTALFPSNEPNPQRIPPGAPPTADGVVGWSIERRARVPYDDAILHTPPLVQPTWDCYGRADGNRLSPSCGRGARGPYGCRGQSMPASLYRHSGLSDGIGRGSDSETGHRSVAPERPSTHALVHSHNGRFNQTATYAQDWPASSPFDVSRRFCGNTSPHFGDAPFGRPTTLLSTGRASDFWPSARPTTLLPPPSVQPSTATDSCATAAAGLTASDTTTRWHGDSPESHPQVPIAPQLPRTHTTVFPPYASALPWADRGDGQDGATALGGDSPCGPLDGCTQVWAVSGESPDEGGRPPHTRHKCAVTHAHDGGSDDALLRSPPRVTASGSLSLACSRPQPGALQRSCSVNEFPWRRSGLQERTVAAPPVNDGLPSSSPVPGVSGAFRPCPSAAPVFCTELPGDETGALFGVPAAALPAGTQVCANDNGWADELTQSNTDFAAIADLDHAPRKSYRHESTAPEDIADGADDRAMDGQLGSSTYAHPCDSAPPQERTPSCTSSAHIPATRRIVDAYTTEEEEDDDDDVSHAHYRNNHPSAGQRLDDGVRGEDLEQEALLVPDPRAQCGWPQAVPTTVSSAWLGATGFGVVGGFTTHPSGPGVLEEEGEDASETGCGDVAGRVRTISRRQAMETRLSRCGHSQPAAASTMAGAALSQEDCGYISSIGLVDDTQVSLDLGAQLASIRVQASPTHKRLAFEEALDEYDPFISSEATNEEARFSSFGRLSGVDALSARAAPNLALAGDGVTGTERNLTSTTGCGGTDPASPCCLSSTLTFDAHAPHVSGVWAGRRPTRRYTMRRGTTSSSTEAESGLSLLRSRKRCLEEMNGPSGGADADVAGFFAVMMVAADGSAPTQWHASADGCGTCRPTLVSVAQTTTAAPAIAHKKFRLDPESDLATATVLRREDTRMVPPTTSPLVLSDRSPNVLFGTSPSGQRKPHHCSNEVEAAVQWHNPQPNSGVQPAQ